MTWITFIPRAPRPPVDPAALPRPANCIPPPGNGNVLQVTPWADFQKMTSSDIQAIWEYLNTIPCIDNYWSTPPASALNELRNKCELSFFAKTNLDEILRSIDVKQTYVRDA